MLTGTDLADVAARFGVAEDQVRRDHLISHVLVALAALDLPDLVFFGGTALARSHLVDGRLSEDIDLYTARRRPDAEVLDTRVRPSCSAR